MSNASGSAGPEGGVMVAADIADLTSAQRKCLQWRMDNQANQLNPELFAEYVKLKGRQKKAKLLEMFFQNGERIHSAMDLFLERERVESFKLDEAWRPMTRQQIHDRYGKEAGERKVQALLKDKQYTADEHFPEDIDFHLFNVHVGTSQAPAP